MKLTAWFVPGAVALFATVLSGAAQDFVAGKVYVAEIAGGVAYTVGGSLAELKKGDTVPVQGARNETAPSAHVVFVYSNGTSLYVDEKTIVEIVRFVQKPFPKGTDTTVTEPSISQTLGRITQGRIIITTNKLATGTTMLYRTPHAEVKIRGQEVVIEVYDRESRIIVINGDVTVTPVGASGQNAGLVLHSGQMVTVTDSSMSSPSVPLQVLAIDPGLLASLAGQLAAGERARQIVVFENVTGAGGPEIQANPVVPANPPVTLTVSPSTLRTGG
jgi:hypothetical protein